MRDNLLINSTRTDRSLLRLFRAGSQAAASLFYGRYAGRLYDFVRARCPQPIAPCIDSDDIVQSVFHRFFRRVNDGHYDVPGEGDLWRLILVIALNKIRDERDFHHALKRNVLQTTTAAPLETCADQGLESALSVAAINEALNRLPVSHKNVVTLRIEGLTIAEIAAQISRSKRTVERMLQEARDRLKESLDKS